MIPRIDQVAVPLELWSQFMVPVVVPVVVPLKIVVRSYSDQHAPLDGKTPPIHNIMKPSIAKTRKTKFILYFSLPDIFPESVYWVAGVTK